jgi:hypothetical protein
MFTTPGFHCIYAASTLLAFYIYHFLSNAFKLSAKIVLLYFSHFDPLGPFLPFFVFSQTIDSCDHWISFSFQSGFALSSVSSLSSAHSRVLEFTAASL